MLDIAKPSSAWYWHHRLQGHDTLKAMEGIGMKQVKREGKGREERQKQQGQEYTH
jgi:hypothetical protein